MVALLWEPMNTIAAVPKAKKRLSVGGQIVMIIIWSVIAGLDLQRAGYEYRHPRELYEWIGELIMGIGFLIGAIAFAVRLKRETESR